MKEINLPDCPVCGSEVFVTYHGEEKYRCQCFKCFPVEDEKEHLLFSGNDPDQAWMSWNSAVSFMRYSLETYDIEQGE